MHYFAVPVSVAPTQLCHSSRKATKDNGYTNGWDCVPIKLYLQKTSGRLELALGV